MQNPMRFIDLGLVFASVGKSLIKVIKEFFLFICHRFKSRQHNSSDIAPRQALKIALTLETARDKLFCYLVILFLPKETSH